MISFHEQVRERVLATLICMYTVVLFDEYIPIKLTNTVRSQVIEKGSDSQEDRVCERR
jgi:bifunctional ADP-heptose synthase (sugar kinase/adenylyltransferase)